MIKVIGILPWVYSIAFGITPLFTKQRFVLDGYLTSCTFDYINRDWETRICQLCLVVGGFVVPFVITIVFYLLTLREIHLCEKENIKTENTTQNLIQRRDSGFINLKQERKNLNIVLIYLIIYCLTWTPYACMSIYAQFGIDIHTFLTPYTILPASLLTKVALIYSPIMFSLAYVDARKWCWSF